MQLKNEKEMNPITKLTSLSSTTSCSTTSTDSGVIFIDNRATFNQNRHSDRSDKANSKSDRSTAKDTEIETKTTQAEDIKCVSPTNKGIHIKNTLNISNGNNSKTTNIKNQTSNNNNSPTLSIRSTTISIVSIDENAIDSSVIDTDSEIEADAEGVHTNYIVKKLGQQITYPPNSPNLPNINEGLTVIGQQIQQPNGTAIGHSSHTPMLNANGSVVTPIAGAASQIGSIALTNSTDVTFGDKHFYEGPVTIQQFLIDSRDKSKRLDDDNAKAGHDNPNFNGVATASTANGFITQLEALPRTISRKAVWITSIFVLLTLLLGTLIIAIFAQSTDATQSKILDSEDSRLNIPINSTIDDIFDGTLKMLNYPDWGGIPPKNKLEKLKLPLHRVIISHTATENCSDKITCSYRVRVIQGFHMDSFNWSDVGYNFLVGGDGLVYVGRGWDTQGAHTKGYNTDSVGISLIGTFTNIEPTENQLRAAQLLIEDGVLKQKLVADYKLYGARQLGATESPGEMLYKIIKMWPHWSAEI